MNWYRTTIHTACVTEVRIPLCLQADVHTKKLLCQGNKREKSAWIDELEKKSIKSYKESNWRKKHERSYVSFMRHSRYLNVCHISGDLLNSIYYNVMFGLNGKSMAGQALHHGDHTKAISNWHTEGLCDWFRLLLDFNTVRRELIDSQRRSCGLSTNCQMGPSSFFFHPPSSFSLSRLFSFSIFTSCLLVSGLTCRGRIRWINRATLDNGKMSF